MNVKLTLAFALLCAVVALMAMAYLVLVALSPDTAVIDLERMVVAVTCAVQIGLWIVHVCYSRLAISAEEQHNNVRCDDVHLPPEPSSTYRPQFRLHQGREMNASLEQVASAVFDE